MMCTYNVYVRSLSGAVCDTAHRVHIARGVAFRPRGANNGRRLIVTQVIPPRSHLIFWHPCSHRACVPSAPRSAYSKNTRGSSQTTANPLITPLLRMHGVS